MSEGLGPDGTARSPLLLVSSLFVLIIVAMALIAVTFAMSASSATTTTFTVTYTTSSATSSTRSIITTTTEGTIYVQGVVKAETPSLAFNFTGYILDFLVLKECGKNGICIPLAWDNYVPLNSTGGYQANFTTPYANVYEVTLLNCTTIGSDMTGGMSVNHEACNLFPLMVTLYSGRTTLSITLSFTIGFPLNRIQGVHCFSHLAPRLIPT